jgi:hypothetical protein
MGMKVSNTLTATLVAVALISILPTQLATAASEPSAKEGRPSLSGFKTHQQWENRGRKTASAAFETHCWAIEHRNLAVLAETLLLTKKSRDRMAEVFERLPEGQKRDYKTPEGMLCALWALEPLACDALLVTGEKSEGAEDVKVNVKFLNVGNNSLVEKDILFRSTPDGWRKVVRDGPVENFLKRLGDSDASGSAVKK